MSKMISLRLPDALAAALDAYASEHNTTRTAAIMSLLDGGLGGTLERMTTEIQRCDTAEWLERLVAVEAAVARLEERMTGVSPAVSQAPATPAELDSSRFYLGKLCPNLHEYGTTGMSRRAKRHGGCCMCEAERARQRRAARSSRDAGVTHHKGAP